MEGWRGTHLSCRSCRQPGSRTISGSQQGGPEGRGTHLSCRSCRARSDSCSFMVSSLSCDSCCFRFRSDSVRDVVTAADM